DEPFGQRGRALAALLRGLDDLVVDVGVVADVTDPIAPVPQITHHDIEDGEGPGVPDVHPRVDRGATDVQAHFTGQERPERLLAVGQRVVDREGGWAFHLMLRPNWANVTSLHGKLGTRRSLWSAHGVVVEPEAATPASSAGRRAQGFHRRHHRAPLR